MEKIPYLKELGVNQIQCMPVYDFLDNKNIRITGDMEMPIALHQKDFMHLKKIRGKNLKIW